MSIITCPGCGNAVSDEVSSCIHCGYPVFSHINYEPQLGLEDNFTAYTTRRNVSTPKYFQKSTQSSTARKRNKRKRKWLILIIIIILTVIIANIIGAYRDVQKGNLGRMQSFADTVMSGPEITEYEQWYLDTHRSEYQPEYYPEYKGKIVDSNNGAYSAYHKQLTSAQYGDIYFAKYYLYDMDCDNVDEMIVMAGTCEADAQLIVYDYCNGEIINVGYLSGGHSRVYGSSAGEGLILHYGHMGHEVISNITSTSAGLIVSELLNRETESYSHMDYFVELTPYVINDFAPFSTNYTTESAQHSYEPQIGMTTEQVLDSLWGEPLDIIKYTSALGDTEIWFYEIGTITFEDGVVESIME